MVEMDPLYRGMLPSTRRGVLFRNPSHRATCTRSIRAGDRLLGAWGHAWDICCTARPTLIFLRDSSDFIVPRRRALMNLFQVAPASRSAARASPISAVSRSRCLWRLGRSNRYTVDRIGPVLPDTRLVGGFFSPPGLLVHGYMGSLLNRAPMSVQG